MNKVMKICKDCKHSSLTGYRGIGRNKYRECNRWGFKVNIVTGSEWSVKSKPCSKERSDLLNFDRCGKEGKYFEQQEEQK